MVTETKARLRHLGAVLLSAVWICSPASASAGTYGAASPAPILYSNLKLPNGNTATVYSNGIARVFTKDHSKVATEIIRTGTRYDGGPNSVQAQLPDEGHIIAQLTARTSQPFATNRVIVVYRDGISTPQDVITVDHPALQTMRAAVSKHTMLTASVPSYTTDVTLNRALGTLGVDRSERLFRQFSRASLSALRSRATTSAGAPLNFANAYRLHVSDASVRQAVLSLAKLPQVAYVSPDWTVSTMQTPGVPLKSSTVQVAKQQAVSMMYRPRMAMSSATVSTQTLPANYALTSSAQSLLNATGVDAAAAYDEIENRFHQLPGTGEIITNVSLGDLDDASEAANTNDPCSSFVQYLGPTTEIINGQRYLNMPSMPLIPTYTADSTGNLNPTGSVCGVDPVLGEIGLDFSVMAPLPHDQQRAGEVGSGLTDLLGIAPGANYRLIVPGTSSASYTDIDAAILGASLQTPKPNVITASLGFGYDSYGFAGRYLEEDPLSYAIIEAIVQSDNIVVCISANDGTRAYTNVAIGPSGGSVPTNVIPSGATPTNLNDDAFSTTPSLVYDSGSIDVGGTTLDDIFANPPQYAMSPQAIAQHAYAETRWTGSSNFSSGFGSRVNVSAPSDNILSFEHNIGGGDDSVALGLSGGTSASAPETAAAAAVVLQVARLTNKPLTALGVRQLLEQTGTPVPNVNQADTNLNVGPQVDLRAAVESMMGSSGKPGSSVARVAVEQRVDYADLNSYFLSATDPTNINLSGGPRPGANWLAWITIAPDWEFIPKTARYELFVKGKPMAVLATTSSARLLPATIFNAAKLDTHTTTSKSVTLTYEAVQGNKVLASADIPLTFGAPPATQDAILAPKVPAVASGTTIPVQYDLSSVGDLNNAQLIVSEPGRFLPNSGSTSQLFHPLYTRPLSQTKGTINVPVSSLQGGGIYGIAIVNNSAVNGTYYSDFAFTRVAPTAAARPSAPVLSINGSMPGHYLEIPYGSRFQVSYDVTNVPGATGAELEFSAAGPGGWGIYNPINNPNGSIRDNNGVDSGSVYYTPVSGKKGTVTINASTAGLYAAFNHVVRVIPTNGGTAVGEGSDVSTITMDGILAEDGGDTSNGFGVNPNGTDGFLTSATYLANGLYMTSVETFDQTTGQITQNLSPNSAANEVPTTLGTGIWGNDVGLSCILFTTNCNLLNTVASGTIGAPFSLAMLPSSTFIQEVAANTANDNVAILASTYTTSMQWQLTTANLLNSSATSSYPINPAGAISPYYFQIGENTNTNTAVLTYRDFGGDSNAPPTIVLVNLVNGQMTQFTGQGSGAPQGLAVDSATNKAAVPTFNDAGLTIYNLATQTGNEVSLPECPLLSCFGVYPAADSTHSLFLVAQPGSPDWDTNNNTLSQVLEYDENGNLLKTIKRFNLYNVFLLSANNLLQLNPNTRRGYLIGPGLQQLIPFNY